MLLEHVGFEVDESFSADVHENRANWFCRVSKLAPLVGRGAELGQYLFVRAKYKGAGKRGRPSWLFRSFGNVKGEE